MLDFMYRPEFADSVPPLLVLGSVDRVHKHLDGVRFEEGGALPFRDRTCEEIRGFLNSNVVSY